MTERMMAYNGHGGEIGMLTLAEAQARYGRHNVTLERETRTLSVTDGECGCCVPPRAEAEVVEG